MNENERSILTMLRDNPRMCWLSKSTPWKELLKRGFITVTTVGDDGTARCWITDEGIAALAK